MKLSIIIVNYNVKYFLEQCLHAVQKALQDIDSEVIVVDNNSVDGSCAMLKEKFTGITLIENAKNVGFSTANNQGINISKGAYVLLLNPDTVVQEDSFRKCIAFMDENQQAGAIGVKMIDGKGNFLPESKRALPTPEVAFFKIFGLSALFPNSKLFGRYHLGFLDKNETHEVDVLSGAYMFIRRAALEQSGLLDEAFFMYGEDIDLSYRICKAGYKNYYFAGTTIIHYKGESTKKGSLNYVVVFYNAMIIFAKKHFSSKNFKFFSFIIHFAIYLRAAFAIGKRFLKSIFLPVADALLIFTGYLFLKPWSESMKFNDGGHYPFYYLSVIVPIYILIWIVSSLFAGAYDKPVKISAIFKGIGVGTIIILAIYALIPLDFRFSRLLIILGALWSVLSLLFFRYLLHITHNKQFKLSGIDRKRIVIVGSEFESKRVRQLLLQTQANPDILGYVSNDASTDIDYLGNISQLDEIVHIYKSDEIIFCAKDIPSHEIINRMLLLTSNEVEYKIAPPESLSIIGSNSINTAGDMYLIDIKAINLPANIREKRLFDILVSIILLALSPVLVFVVKGHLHFLLNGFQVLVGKYSWIGYTTRYETTHLPKIKKGILSPVDGLRGRKVSEDLISKLNIFYAKDYKFTNDLNILMRGLLYCGRKIL